jgi:predicted ATPase
MPLTPLIGRALEVAHVCDLLRQPQVRLVTLTGAGGIGKTRLSLQVAAELRSVFYDGVQFVPLAAIRDPGQIVPAIAQAISIGEAGGQPLLEGIRQALSEKQVLLVLDNVEQIDGAPPLIGDLLEAMPRLTVLVTSRVPLHLDGEQQYAVLPLRVPDVRGNLSVEAVSKVESAQLLRSERRRRSSISGSRREMSRPSRRSAGGWMACPWRSCSRQRASRC